MKSATMKCIFFMTTFLSTVQLWAQDKKMDVDIDINKKDADWYMQPWGQRFSLSLLLLF